MDKLRFNGKYLLAILLAAVATALCCTVDVITKEDNFNPGWQEE